MKLSLLDSTLRDGTQGEGIALLKDDKIKIIEALDRLGIDYIEAGNPASNPKDAELFQQLKEKKLTYSKICAFGSTRRKNIKVEEDFGLKALLEADTEAVSIVGKASIKQVREVLRTSPEENLLMISDTVDYLKSLGKFVIFDAEHFFDGYKEDSEYAISALNAAKNADVLCLCDTNGGSFTEDIFELSKCVCEAFPDKRIGIHCHNDCGLAVANTMHAVKAGAVHIQGTFLGFGERCGNTVLATVIPNLQLKLGYECIAPENMRLLTPTARRISDITNFALPSSRPYIGKSAFAHKGGMHIDAVTKESSSFEHIDPKLVGNHRRFLISEMSGKATLMARLRAIDPSITRDSPKLEQIIEELKLREMSGYQFEGAEESFELIIRRKLGIMPKFFDLDYFKILGEQPMLSSEYPSSAVMKVRVNGETEMTAAEGNGPVNALDLALRKALIRFYPKLKEMRLTDFKVRVLESDATTAATVRVLIESSDGIHHWSTIGVSPDVIGASFIALRDSVEYKLMLDSLSEF